MRPSRTRGDEPIDVLPLEDRLLEEPPVLDPLDAVRDAVLRSLDDLLNTRERPALAPGDADQLSRSLVDYGIPDFIGTSYVDPMSKVELERTIRQRIEAFEPRLSRVRVKMTQPPREMARSLRFVVLAQLAGRQDVRFDTMFNPVNGEFQLEEEGG